MPVSDIQTSDAQTRTRTRLNASHFLLAGFSVYYFVNVLVRASEKQFWFDEIVTVYLCRLPNVHAIWQALLHGVDYNPLFFYMVTRASKALLGENLIGMRMPEIIGFWVMCLCLFRFVNRRVGPFGGLIAMVLPTLSGGLYYAYEARPHGITLGFAGLAVVSWQMSMEDQRRRRWLVALALSLLGAFMIHCYTLLLFIPFATVEMFRSFQSRRIHWPTWMALVTPALIAVASYVPLFLAYRTHLGATNFTTVFPPGIGQITGFYGSILWPSVAVILIALALFASDRVISSPRENFEWIERWSTIKIEVLLGTAFLLIPVFGAVLAAVVRGPFIARYFLSALLGVSILLGLAAGIRSHGKWVGLVLVLATLCSAGWQFSALVWHRYHGMAEPLSEPSAGILLNTSTGSPLDLHKLLLSDSSSLPIVVPRGLEFMYLLFYAPPQLRSRLYYVSEQTSYLQAARNLNEWCPGEYDTGHFLMFNEFARRFPRFLVYTDPGDLPDFVKMVHAGGNVKSIRMSTVEWHFLAEIEK